MLLPFCLGLRIKNRTVKVAENKNKFHFKTLKIRVDFCEKPQLYKKILINPIFSGL